jgi:hypothetical protein
MKCGTCGMEYGMTHNCAGALPTVALPEIVAEETAPPPRGFSPVHYFREALRIATWDENAIRRISRDPNALFYGIAIWAILSSLPLVIVAVELYAAGRSQGALRVLVKLATLLPVDALWALVQIGICFAVAKSFMAGGGRFVEILRPLLLGSIVFVLLVIPYVGIFAASIAWVCVFAMVFQEIDGVEPLTSYVLSIIVGIATRLLEVNLAGVFR